MNRRLHVPVLTVMASVLLVMIPLPAVAQTSGVERMEKAGWVCEDFGPVLGIHCWGQSIFSLDGDGPIAVPARVFDQDGVTYRGTELLIRADVFERNPNVLRPCPQEGGHWHDLSDALGPDSVLPYYGCHHFD